MATQLITFEDHHQDFLTWTTTDGIVTDCQPFQGWLWCGKEVRVEDGFAFYKDEDGMAAPIKYPVISVEDLPS